MSSHKHLLILSAMLGKEPDKSGGLSSKECRRAIERIFAIFRESDLDNLIWSHEGISTRVFNLDVDYARQLVDKLDVRIVFFARYVDDWVESLYKERIRAQGGNGKGRIGRSKPRLNPKPLLPLAPRLEARGEGAPHGKKMRSMLEEGSDIPRSMGAFREVFPSAEIVVQSYDANREQGAVVSGALAAMGVPVGSAFPDADGVASVQNPTKSNLYSMLIYHLVLGQADPEVVRAVTSATIVRDRKGIEFAPLVGRRFRFLSEENILAARAYYDQLREEFPHLPPQPAHAPDPAERSLPRDEGVALLDWLRPAISDEVFDKACAAYFDLQ